jgi:hypothetical protein
MQPIMRVRLCWIHYRLHTFNVNAPRAHAWGVCGRMLAAQAYVHSLILGRIISKLGGKILQIIKRYMGYLVCVNASANNVL